MIARSMVSVWMVLALVVGLAGVACNSGHDPAAGTDQVFVSVPSETATGGLTAQEMEAARLSLHRALTDDQVVLGAETPIVVELSQTELFDYALMEAERREIAPGPRLIGVAHPVGVTIDLETTGSVGAMRSEPDRFVWTSVVRSVDAKAIRIHFAKVELSKGTELYVYNIHGEAYGPLTGTDVWSPSLAGSEAYIQITGANPAARLVISDVGHIDPAALSLDSPEADEKYNIGTQCYGAWCTQNANCHSWAHMAATKKAVAHIQYIDGPWLYLCSGGLLADSDGGSQIPYFITANHCVSTQSVANTLEAFFQFDAVCSSDCGDAEQAGIKVAGGATVLRTNGTSDFTLLELNGTPPGDSVYLGWSSQTIAYSHGAMLHRIAHPAGGPQSYSEHYVDTGKGTCGSWPRGNWIYSTDTLGATEGGSSGSVVLNASGQVVGQLSGGCGTNVYDECDSVSNATVDGAFAAYYDQVSSWLGTGAGCTVPADCDDGDACNGAEDCVAGDCVSGTTLDCDDSNPCTDDSCDPGSGCVNTDNTDPCSDGDACTTGDACSGGSCVGGPLRDGDSDTYVDELCGGDDCDDGNFNINPGVSEVCDDSIDNNCDGETDEGCGCSGDPECDDGNACNGAETCVAGSCQPGTPLTCDDGNVCNGAETCNPASGCVAGTPLTCNDGNPCTDDGCDAASGCVFTNNTDPCNDGDACTTSDTCSGGACSGTPVNCDDGDVCNGSETCDPGTGCIAGTPLDCDDGNECTVDSCDAGTGCDNTAVVDGTPCAGGECQGGTCVSTGLPVSVGTATSGSSWTTVNLGQSYGSMVVVAAPSYTSGAPKVVRVRNAAGSSFEFIVQEAGGGAVSGIPIHYFVVEEGVYTVGADGVKMEAVKYNSTRTDNRRSWVGQSRSYQQSYSTPVVLGQVMTYNDPDWSVFWARGGSRSSPPSSSTLYVGKNVAEDSDTTRANETVGYIVIEAGSGSMGGIAYTAALGADSIRGFSNSPPYNYSVSGLPAIGNAVVSAAAMDGNNGGWPALYGTPSGTTLPLVFDEDQIRDSERKHTTEQVAYIAFE